MALVTGFATAAEAPRQYDIELLVFRNLVENDGGERWQPDYSDWLESADAAPAGSAVVNWLGDSGLRLTRQAAALRASSQYRPVAHFAWRQTVSDRDQAKPVTLPASGRQGGAWVEGTARVAVERYLHLSLDLQLHLPQTASPPVDELVAYQEPRFRLVEQRRMRSRELHYFDNPRFGVLALITPYEAPVSAEPAAAAPADSIMP
ncbi:MAG: hypothetical protein J5I92_00280 [Thiogranum sp.]|nr:hypothetical protein [Thiogranum sp.]